MLQKRRTEYKAPKPDKEEYRDLPSAGTKTLLCYHEIPSWQQENEYILTGYRPTSGSIKKSLKDLCYLNNESGGRSLQRHVNEF